MMDYDGQNNELDLLKSANYPTRKIDINEWVWKGMEEFFLFLELKTFVQVVMSSRNILSNFFNWNFCDIL